MTRLWMIVLRILKECLLTYNKSYMKQIIEKAARIEREKIIQELHAAYKIHKDPNHYITSSATIGQYAVPLFKKGAEWQKEQVIEILSSVLENWVHGGDADCIIAEFEERLND